MKIIKVDNFGRETMSDQLIAKNVLEYYAYPITEFLNKKFSGNNSQYFFRTVDDNYPLHIWEP